jgi:trehalose 6-phosphate phosphatase
LKIVKTVGNDKSLELMHGEKVVEIRPKGWNKGKAVELIYINYASKNVLPVYIGDDTTDEDAFQVIGNQGISIFVKNDSNRSTIANYWLKNPDDVLKFLKSIEHK